MKLSTITSTLLLSSSVPVVHLPAARPSQPDLVLFPGTQTAKDLFLDDLDVRTKVWPEGAPEEERNGIRGCVHRGFARRTGSLMDSVRHAYDVAGSGGIVLAGHSMGGACAVLAAAQLWQWDRVLCHAKVVRVLTFGMPRMACHEFAEGYRRQLGSRTTHFSTPEDPVVHRLPALYSYPTKAEYVGVPCDSAQPWEHHDMQSYHDALCNFLE